MPKVSTSVSFQMQKLLNENQHWVEKISSQTEHISTLEKMLQKPPPTPPTAKEPDDQLVADLKKEIQNLFDDKKKRSRNMKQFYYRLVIIDEFQNIKRIFFYHMKNACFSHSKEYVK